MGEESLRVDECARCGKMIADRWEPCWYCEARLCEPCAEAVGHCGHPEAEAINAATSEERTWEERDALVRRLKQRQ